MELQPNLVAPSKTRRQQFIERSHAQKANLNNVDREPKLKTELERIVTDIHRMKEAYKSLEGVLKGKHRNDIDVLVAKVEHIMVNSVPNEEKIIQLIELLKEDYKKAKSHHTPSFLNKERSFLEDVNCSSNSHHYSRMLGLILANLFAVAELPEKLRHKDLNIITEVSHIIPSSQKEYSTFSFMSQSNTSAEDKDEKNIQPH
ncbi:hypothetical protein [Legionella fallonii]|uniref:Uncharacterized protein n=1 Tax=Legionella fallonii LLAP-10 TaxID=1212491 RepID=A0A098G2B0_9GAMM|nr:hypothetical protein [Legionella fallonii]CEG56104.1 protein of unknown function [Legionella fallonii LLAP-10]